MCNCGKKRMSYTSPAKTSNSNQILKEQQQVVQQASTAQQQATSQNQTVMFKYTGNTALTVVGSVTRKSYRFNFPGDIQHIASRDAAGFISIPVLKKM